MDIKQIISSGIAELYVLGMASEEESRQVEQLAAQYPEMQKELDEIRESLGLYAASFAKQPDASLKSKIENQFLASSFLQAPKEEIKETNKEPAVVYRMPAFAKFAAAASVVLLAGSLVFNYIQYNKYNKTAEELATVKAASDQQVALNNQMKSEMQIISSKYSEAVSLAGTEKFPEAAAKVYWIKNTGEVYVDPSSLPVAPAGKQYQLWALIDGTPYDAGMVEKDGKRLIIQRMKSFEKVNAFAITLEKDGGSPTPDMSQLYVLGTL